MKKCKHCGTPQNDTRFFCIDCGRPLGKSLSVEETEAIEDALDAKINQTAFHDDVFEVTHTDKILGIIGIIGLIAACILFAVSQTELNHINRDFQEALMEAAMAGDPFAAIEIVDPTKQRQPSREDYLTNSVSGAAIAVIFFLISIVLLLIPRLFWWWDTLRYRIRFNEEPSPSTFDAACMKFFKYAGLLIGAAALAYSAWMYF